jgi:hypothetical protein
MSKIVIDTWKCFWFVHGRNTFASTSDRPRLTKNWKVKYATVCWENQLCATLFTLVSCRCDLVGEILAGVIVDLCSGGRYNCERKNVLAIRNAADFAK